MQQAELELYIRDTFQVSHARACKVSGSARTGKYYTKKMPLKDQALKEIISQVIGTSRKGRNKVIVLIRKKYPQLSGSKIRRIYQKEGFSLYKRYRKRRKQNPVNPIHIPFKKNLEWAIDFMSDALSNGRRFRTLNVIDHFNRECKGISVGFNLPSAKVISELEKMIDLHGKPERIRTDNGPEFTSKRFQLWLKRSSIEWSPIQAGKPQQNAIVERFNKTFREDILDAHLFESIQDAQCLADFWCEDYNNVRPHQSLNYKTPMEYAA